MITSGSNAPYRISAHSYFSSTRIFFFQPEKQKAVRIFKTRRRQPQRRPRARDADPCMGLSKEARAGRVCSGHRRASRQTAGNRSPRFRCDVQGWHQLSPGSWPSTLLPGAPRATRTYLVFLLLLLFGLKVPWFGRPQLSTFR